MRIESNDNAMRDASAHVKINDSPILQKVDRWLTWIEKSFMIFSAIILFVMLFAVSYGAIGRYFFQLKTAWTMQLSEYMMVFLCFLAVPWILKNDGHVQVDILTNAVSNRVRRMLSLFTVGISLACCMLLFWFSLQNVIDSFERHVITVSVLQVPKYLIMLPIPVGSLFLVFRFLHQLLNLIRER